MKKNNLGLIMSLSILLAISSGFINPIVKLFLVTYEFWGINTDALPWSQPTVSQVDANGAQFASSSSNITIAQAFAATGQSDGCLADANHLCAVKIKNQDGVRTVAEYVSGDFFSQIP